MQDFYPVLGRGLAPVEAERNSSQHLYFRNTPEVWVSGFFGHFSDTSVTFLPDSFCRTPFAAGWALRVWSPPPSKPSSLKRRNKEIHKEQGQEDLRIELKLKFGVFGDLCPVLHVGPISYSLGGEAFRNPRVGLGIIQGEIISPPPLPPFLAKRHLSGEGGGGCIFWGPTRQEFYTPPSFIRGVDKGPLMGLREIHLFSCFVENEEVGRPYLYLLELDIFEKPPDPQSPNPPPQRQKRNSPNPKIFELPQK